jgi:hypothetical protein
MTLTLKLFGGKMEPVTAIIGAIAAGAAAAAKDTASQAVKDAYSGVKSMILKHFSNKNKAEGEMVLTNYTTKPDTWKAPMKEALLETDADKSADIMAAVEKLQKALEEMQGGPEVMAKYNIKNSKVGVIGDGTIVKGDVNIES